MARTVWDYQSRAIRPQRFRDSIIETFVKEEFNGMVIKTIPSRTNPFSLLFLPATGIGMLSFSKYQFFLAVNLSSPSIIIKSKLFYSPKNLPFFFFWRINFMKVKYSQANITRPLCKILLKYQAFYLKRAYITFEQRCSRISCVK